MHGYCDVLVNYMQKVYKNKKIKISPISVHDMYEDDLGEEMEVLVHTGIQLDNGKIVDGCNLYDNDNEFFYFVKNEYEEYDEMYLVKGDLAQNMINRNIKASGTLFNQIKRDYKNNQKMIQEFQIDLYYIEKFIDCVNKNYLKITKDNIDKVIRNQVKDLNNLKNLKMDEAKKVDLLAKNILNRFSLNKKETDVFMFLVGYIESEYPYTDLVDKLFKYLSR